MRGTLEVALKANLHPRHQHCTDEAQNPKQYCLQLVIYIYIYIYIYFAQWRIGFPFNALFETRRVSAYAFIRGLNSSYSFTKES